MEKKSFLNQQSSYTFHEKIGPKRISDAGELEKTRRRLYSVDCLETTLFVDVESLAPWRCGDYLDTAVI